MATLVDLKTTITQGQFQSISRAIIQRILGRLFPNLRDRPISKATFSVSLAAIFFLLFVLGIAGNKLFGTPQVDEQIFTIFVIGIIYIYILCVVIEYQIDNSLKTVRDSLLDSLVRDEDRTQLQESMDNIFSVRNQSWFGIIFSVLAHAAFIAIEPSLVLRFGIGFLLVNMVFHAFHGFCVYFFVAYLSWAISDLQNYHYDLFELDPSNTEIIAKLATLLQSTTSIMTLMVASGTIIASTTRVLPFVGVAGMVVFTWINTITLYLVNRHILKSIILRAKWQKLGKIQTQIRELEGKDPIPTKEALDHITQLKEYHDHIKSTPNSPWDVSQFINTLNSLVWPTIGAIATNVEGFVDMIQKVFKGQLP